MRSSLIYYRRRIAIAAAVLLHSGIAHAEAAAATAETVALNPVVVVGQRASLATAQEIKQEKIEIVDSVVADDIGKLPDISVGEALQRVTGVQVNRDRGESTVITIRGLTQVETLLNGREVFTAGNGRNLDFSDFPAEMISRIDVYKTSSAAHIEGGIGGLVDLRTHRPFDFAGREIVLSGRAIRGDVIDDTKPQFSLLASNRWQTSGRGEFGALINLVHQQRAWREDQETLGKFEARTLAGQSVNVPTSIFESTSVGERKRTSGNIVLQWRPTDALDLYAEGSYVEFRTVQDAFQFFTRGQPTTFVAGSPVLSPGTHDLQSITWTNVNIATSNFARDTIDRTSQLAVGGSWTHRALTLKTDLSYTRSYNNLFFLSTTLNGTVANLTQNLSSRAPGLSVAGTDLLAPANFTYAGLTYASRPFNGELAAAQLDGEYQFVDGVLDTLSGGVRYARRDATNQPGQVVALPTVNQPASNFGGLVVANPYGEFFPGSTGVGNYLVGASSRDLDALLGALGITATIPTGNPLGTWTIAEETTSGYATATFQAHGIPLDGNAGLRLVRTQETVSGFESIPSSGTVAPVRLDNTYTDLLPSMNLRYQFNPGLFLRAAASQTLTRPDFNQMSPSLTLNPALGTGSAGNPALRPVRADNLDLAIERYVNRTTAIYLTAFFKKADGFVTTFSNPEIHDRQLYQISRPQNSAVSYIRGAELGYQQFYDFLPGWLGGLGLQANYTYIDSQTYNKTLQQNVALQNISKHNYNVIGMYEKGPLSARIAYNWRGKFLTDVTTLAGIGAVPVYTRAYGWLDASVGYRFTDKITLAVEGSNLLRTVRSSYYGTETRPKDSFINDRQLSAILTVRF